MRELNSSNRLAGGRAQTEPEEGVQHDNGKDRQQGHTCFPAAQGLYHPKYERDACGIGFVVNIKGKQSHEIVRQALTVLLISRIVAQLVPSQIQGMGPAFCCKPPINFSKK